MPLNLYDHSEFVEDDGKITTINRIQGTLKFGSGWYEDMHAQEKIIGRLDAVLNDRYFLLRNFRLQDVDHPVPLILIGPPGVQIIYPTDESGFFELKGETWLKLDKRKKEYVPAKPNHVARTLTFNEALTNILKANNFNLTPLPPVILFTNAHIHIESLNPAVRTFLVDAMNKFIRSVPNPMGPLTHYGAETLAKYLEEQSRKILVPPVEKKPDNDFRVGIFDGFMGRFNFNTRQWLIIFGLFGLAIALLLVIIALFFIL